ncbi:Histone acetyltransferase KAT6A [Armadillidium nasatum]|uniref:Histone acetyltransferase KAT6A n=1 Tax=Armadillidium nasatum TaxID=96803 RepID=A0A5N5TIJ9_9CRUS|nr:Histone acetyltransferase KAT6A [Armadillidium nasatum]
MHLFKMNDPKDVIINGIRVLRSRRVRPSEKKIAWYAHRNFLQSEKTTAETLEELVRLGDINKVMYKGTHSFRIAPHKAAAAASKILKPIGKKFKLSPTPTDILRPLLSAIAECGGNATIDRIEKELVDANFGHITEKLELYLQKELRVGLIGRRIVPSPSGGRSTSIYYLTKTAPELLIMNRGNTNSNLTPKLNREQNNTSVSPEPPKKAPAPFEHLHQHLKRLKQEKENGKGSEKESDSNSRSNSPTMKEPSSETFPLQQDSENRNNTSGVEYTSRRGRPRKPPAIYEDLTSFTSKRGRPPKFAVARGGKRARKVFDPSDASGKKRCSITENSPSGNVCHRCGVCGLSTSLQNNLEDLLVCHSCSARAHPNCLGYSTELAIKSRLSPWTCMDCKHCAICNMDHNIGTLIFCDECDRAYHLTCHQPPLKKQVHGSWICFACTPNSPGQNEIGFREFADVFKDQDIDGTALLMLTRTDVLTGLDLKLGPALKIYRQIRILQTRLPNPPLP